MRGSNRLLTFGLAAALLGAPILLVTVKLVGGNQLGLAARLALWALAGAVCGIALLAGAPWSHLVGLRVPNWQTLLGAAAATVAVLAAWPLLQYVQGRLGGVSIVVGFLGSARVHLPICCHRRPLGLHCRARCQ